MIDVALLLIFGLVAWNVAAEGAWGAAAVFLSVLFAGLVAMDYFEPLADLLQSGLGIDWASRVDFIALVGLFAAGVFGLRYLSEWLVPSFILVHGRVYDVCRWGFAVLTGYTTIGFLLTALHTAPLPRDFLGFTPERNNFFGTLAPDRDWLGFVQYVSEKSMPSSEEGRIFDGSRFRLPYHENEIWPTFIIRYASRRENFGTAAVAVAPAAAPVPAGGAPHPTQPAGPPGL
ncbi:MAG TPA: CvpA family protein [Planctomycetaceae bacterium]|jgi:hypothetical protein|nr:CvpA family protein [Planctomycetaceae bacterium]